MRGSSLESLPHPISVLNLRLAVPPVLQQWPQALTGEQQFLARGQSSAPHPSRWQSATSYPSGRSRGYLRGPSHYLLEEPVQRCLDDELQASFLSVRRSEAHGREQ